MSEAYGLRDLGGSAEVAARAAKPGIRRRRGLRIALLSLAAAILLLGAAIAGIFGYRAVNGGQSASAALHLQHVPRAMSFALLRSTTPPRHLAVLNIQASQH